MGHMTICPDLTQMMIGLQHFPKSWNIKIPHLFINQVTAGNYKTRNSLFSQLRSSLVVSLDGVKNQDIGMLFPVSVYMY